jgi:two-component system, cell cycle response regulator DivK
MRILYIEDNIPNVMLVQRVARIGRHDVINYPEGEQALKSFESDKPDLVLMDLQLQGTLNGLEVVKILRSQGCATPIIAVTAYAMGGDRQRCLEAGCDDYIPKPVSVNELVSIFSRYQSQVPLQRPVADTKPTTSVPPASTDNISDSKASLIQPPTEKADSPLASSGSTPESQDAQSPSTGDSS